ncbi:MAG: toxin regulator [Clostridia bacterium]
MKKAMIILLVVALLSGSVGCASGVKQEEYDTLKNECTKIQEELKKAKENCSNLEKELQEKGDELKSIKDEYEKLKTDATPFLQLSETEQAAEIAHAEAQKIKAEEEARKAQAAADLEAEKKAKAEATLKAKEEAAKLAEEKKGYNTGITFLNLSRNPDDYVGKKVKFSGKVAQVIEGGSTNAARMSTRGRYDDVIYIEYKTDLIAQRLIDDDIVTICGVADGLYTYTTIMGGTVTLPRIIVVKMEIK